jgi:hypothetical protein
MKRLLTAIALAAAVYVAYTQHDPVTQYSETAARSESVPAIPISEQASGSQIEGFGTVTGILSDDNDGSRHQRFILRLDSGQTLLIAHNIDVAPRVASLSKGDVVRFYGVYESNAKGGLVHWTHHDPGGVHVSGWLKHNGRTYQ